MNDIHSRHGEPISAQLPPGLLRRPARCEFHTGGHSQSTLRLRALILLSLFASPARASYRDGDFGLIVLLFFALPASVGLLLLGLLLRSSGAFDRAWLRQLFVALVGASCAFPLLWALSLGDGPSVLVLAIACGLLAPLATAPAWWRRPVSDAAPAPATLPSPRLRRGLAIYWLASGLLPLASTVVGLLRAGADLPAGVWPLALALPLLLLSLPRWAAAAELLKRPERAKAWLLAALVIAALWLARELAQGAPGALLAWGIGPLLLDLLVWALGRRLLGSQAGALSGAQKG